MSYRFALVMFTSQPPDHGRASVEFIQESVNTFVALSFVNLLRKFL